jgi:hypothetical protein
LDSEATSKTDELIAVLQQLVAAHMKLLGLLQRKRGALANADYQKLTELCEQVNAQVQQISAHEKSRLTLVADLTLIADPAASAPLRMAELADRLPEPTRGVLLVLRQRLLEQMRHVQRETGVARRATQSLVTHMRGMAHTIGALCTGVSVYDRQGAPPPEAIAVSTFNTTA